MNIGAMIIAELKRRRAKAVSQLEAANTVLAIFTNPGSILVKGQKRKKPRSAAQKAAIAKAQEARRKSAVPVKVPAVKTPVTKGAPLAAAAGN